ncbi:MAG: hypothetical protein MJ132_05880 [Clostridia bacterium]|nr:hypothetical protein [Clostridia bacterium]
MKKLLLLCVCLCLLVAAVGCGAKKSTAKNQSAVQDSTEIKPETKPQDVEIEIEDGKTVDKVVIDGQEVEYKTENGKVIVPADKLPQNGGKPSTGTVIYDDKTEQSFDVPETPSTPDAPQGTESETASGSESTETPSGDDTPTSTPQATQSDEGWGNLEF